MGVEYRHFLVVNDATWLPNPDTMPRVEAVLRIWSLVEDLNKAFDLSDGRAKEIDYAHAKGDPGHGIALLFDGISGLPVANIAGPSFYDGILDAERYTMGTALVVGRDYRVHWSSESLYFELVSPAEQNGKAIAPYPYPEDLRGCLFAESFRSEANTSPPEVEIHVADHAAANFGRSNYHGFWRGAVVIDFGKNLPGFVNDLHVLPNQNFVDAIEEAFGAEVAEIGEFF